MRRVETRIAVCQFVLDEELQRAAHYFCRFRQKVRLHEATVSQHTPGAEHERRRHKTKNERRLSRQRCANGEECTFPLSHG